MTRAHDEEHWRTCLHEAGHAWAIVELLGGPLGVVSVRRAVAHLGTTIGDPLHPLPTPHLGGHPLYGLDGAERRLADRWLVEYLIGDEAEQAFDLWPPSGGFDRPMADVAPPTLPPAVDEVLAASEDPRTEASQADGRAATDLATAIVGPVTSGYYLAWAKAEARQAARTHAAPIHALASALWREPIIGGRKATDILEAHGRSTT
jgi:hypothetical protein